MLSIVIDAEKIYIMNKKHLIVIIGPTAIGKTRLSIQLAQHFECEIISADSRQFYKEMSIGTAVPSKEELEQAKHHCIQHKSIHEPYTVGDFEKEGLEIINSIFETQDYAILIGGSGLYIDAITKGLDQFPEVDPTIRQKLQEEFEANGLHTLQEKLKTLDPVHASTMDLQNPHRVIRALEICIATDKPYSSFINKKKEHRNFNIITIGITADREIIYDRINQRVNIMIDQGLVDEAQQLYKYKTLNALNTVGYKEIFQYLDGNWSKDFAISEIKKNTRRFAKRQLTWFRKNENTHWFDYQYELNQIIEHIKTKNKL